ncbi:fad oxidoreductase, putative [Perkinsus marinus ATCC 50983]|uniref:Fad oxidoreductase, putative n=1 Tax=Perkinsus marinus (strain ATCC 50983 / TXsc) TaxID=423536 RepID=C5K503_PERM5|nr:fad oxidoreductase, putative [Perkinsus marinus ATCC 50983]EER20425.1 fad oxidoreductase, putative [Perkinsus marinus ATCC 50983]|eukprot:XP_002788629.1 fad oxidoreductase, putative [Perkinsus marinus ATCC 50983]
MNTSRASAATRAIPTAQTEIHGTKRRCGDGQCSWLDRGTTKSSRRLLCLGQDVADQITPLELNKSLIREAIDLGLLEVRTAAKVVDVVIEEDGKAVTGVVLEDGSIVYGSEVVLAMGAWSCEAEVCSSLVYKETGMAAVSDPHALFCSNDANGCHLEVYPRPDGDIYICGLGGSPQLRPDDLRSIDPSGVQPEAKRVAAGHKSLSAMTSLVDPGKEPDIKQACLRPLLPDALPAMGRLCEGINNLYIVAGHNCWGILWSLASGEAMAELIVHGTSEHLSLSPFDPTRFT